MYICCIKFQHQAKSNLHFHQVVLLTQTKHHLCYNPVTYILPTVTSHMPCKAAAEVRAKDLEISPSPFPPVVSKLAYMLCTTPYIQGEGIKVYFTRGHKIASMSRGIWDTPWPAPIKLQQLEISKKRQRA